MQTRLTLFVPRKQTKAHGQASDSVSETKKLRAHVEEHAFASSADAVSLLPLKPMQRAFSQ